MTIITKKYSNGEVTVVWQPDMCTYAGNCFNGLPDVFNPHKRPWVNPNGATTQKIIEQIKQCPSGALSYYTNNKPVEEPSV